jgi:hypothetical protein
MKHLKNDNKKKNNNNAIVTAASLLTLATIIVIMLSSMATTTSVDATTTSNATTTTTTPTIPPSLSPQPVYQERVTNATQTPINQTHIQFTYSANGTLTLPNTTDTINTTSNGSAIISFITQSAQGTETIRTEDGSETATATFYYITRFHPATGEGKGIAISVFHTDSTGMLAPLNGTILTGITEIQPTGETAVTLWEWQSGIPLPTTTTTPPEEPAPLMDDATTTTTTNATAAADDTNATPAAPAPEEEVGGEGEEQQQQTTIAPNPLFE